MVRTLFLLTKKHAPENLAKFPDLMKKCKGKEALMLRAMREKYEGINSDCGIVADIPKTFNCGVCGQPDHWQHQCPNKLAKKERFAAGQYFQQKGAGKSE